MTNHEGQLPNDAGEQSREAAVQAQSVPAEPVRTESARSEQSRSDASGSGAGQSGVPTAAVAATADDSAATAGASRAATAGSTNAPEAGATVSTVSTVSKAPSKRKRESEPAEVQVTSNNVRRIRIELMLSKAEVARRANISVLTLDRVERGYGCRVDTKRKILEALGLSLADRIRVFGEEE